MAERFPADLSPYDEAMDQGVDQVDFNEAQRVTDRGLYKQVARAFPKKTSTSQPEPTGKTPSGLPMHTTDDFDYYAATGQKRKK